MEQPTVQANSGETSNPLAPPSSGWKWKLAVALLLAAASVFWALHHYAAEKAAAIPPPTIAVTKAERVDLSRELVFDGEFRPYIDIDVFAKVAGFVKTIAVDVGDRVQAGQVLAKLEIPELAEEIEHATAVKNRNEEDVRRAQAAYEEAHVFYERLMNANKAQPGLVAQQDIDDANAHDRSAKSALESAKLQVRVAEVDLKKLHTTQEYTQITAPFAGVITKRFADPGDLVRGGLTPSTQAMPLVRLSQNDRLRLVFPVSAAHVPQIKIGTPVEIRGESVGKPIIAVVARFNREILAATRTMDVEAEVPNADLKLTPGAFASAVLKLEQRKNVIAVPIEAVARQKKATVFVVGKDNKIAERTVKLGLETPAKIEILSGLKEGELVLLGSRAQVKPGQKVETKLIEAAPAE